MAHNLTFNAEALRRVLEHAKAATSYRSIYGGSNTAPVWLLGNHGVYLMSAATVPDMASKDPIKPHVAYAEDLDPSGPNSDEWYDLKLAIFGGDDFVDGIPADWVEIMLQSLDKGRTPAISVEGTSMRLIPNA